MVHTTETGNQATHLIVRFVALTNYYAVNFSTEKHFIMLIQIVLPALEFDKFFKPSNLVIVVKIYA